jgi:pimeloyl-ACP methyl ester carboxylesterase
MTTVDRRAARIAGIDTHWLEAGSGAPVLLLHGVGSSSYSWRSVLPELAARYRVIAPDWPGFGRSEAPYEHDYSLAGQTKWLLAFMDHLEIRAASLAGNSMGGVISLFTAMDHPERVTRLALLGAPTYLGDRPKIMWPLRWPVIGRVYEALLGPTLVRLVGRTAYHDPALMTEETVEEYSLSLRRPQGRRAVAEFLRRAIPDDARERMSRYPSLTHDILVICGDSDAVVSLANAKRFCAEAPRARLLAVSACGHAPQEEHPAAVARALSEFFA